MPLHPIFCKYCKGLLKSPIGNRHLRRKYRGTYRPSPCHHAISVQRMSWSAAVYYGITSSVPEGRSPFEHIGHAQVVPRVMNERLVADGPRWKYA